MSSAYTELNLAAWRSHNLVQDYGGRTLRPAEVILLLRHRDAFTGPVLEVGCGAGRLLGYLLELSNEVHGLDISPRMVEHCHRAYPQADVRLADMRDLAAYPAGPLEVILLSYNILDVLEPDQRQRLLAALADRLTSEGLLVFSSHNLGWIESPSDSPHELSHGEASRARLSGARRVAEKLVHTSPYWTLRALTGLPRRLRNRRRLGPLERRASDYALVNDPVHDYSQLFYYVHRDDQERQLNDIGYELVECLDLDGHTIPRGARSASPELHYIARARRPASTQP